MNKVTSDFNIDQVQKCDESDSGHNNNAECANSSINYLDSIDVLGDNYNINFGINTKQTNDCDEKRDGDNNSECSNNSQDIIDSFTVTGDNNPFVLSLNTEQSNDCDDNSAGDNTAICKNFAQIIVTP